MQIFFFFLKNLLKTNQTSNPGYFISRCNSRILLLCGLFNPFLSYHRCAATPCPKPGEIRFPRYDVLHCLCVVRCLRLHACSVVAVASLSSACFPNRDSRSGSWPGRRSGGGGAWLGCRRGAAHNARPPLCRVAIPSEQDRFTSPQNERC